MSEKQVEFEIREFEGVGYFWRCSALNCTSGPYDDQKDAVASTREFLRERFPDMKVNDPKVTHTSFNGDVKPSHTCPGCEVCEARVYN